MLNAADIANLEAGAYVPEQLPGYVAAMSGGELFLMDGCLVIRKDEMLVVVGYPLEGAMTPERLSGLLDQAADRIRPDVLDVVGPVRPDWRLPFESLASDRYFKLDLDVLKPSRKLRHQLRQADRAYTLVEGRGLGAELTELIRDFGSRRDIDPAMRVLFDRVPGYVESGETAMAIGARDASGRLLGISVFDLAPSGWAFYLFHFRGRGVGVSGVSDLLFWTGLEELRRKGASRVNLGLGVNKGVAFFKEKWGAAAFLPCEHGRARLKTGLISRLFRPKR